MIEVRLYAMLRQGREKIIMLENQGFSTARDIISHLDIPVGEVSILLINGIHKPLDAQVKDGDTVSLFPPVGGG